MSTTANCLSCSAMNASNLRPRYTFLHGDQLSGYVPLQMLFTLRHQSQTRVVWNMGTGEPIHVMTKDNLQSLHNCVPSKISLYNAP